MAGLADGRLVTGDDGRLVATSAAAERDLGKSSVGLFSRPVVPRQITPDEPGVKRTTHEIDTDTGPVGLVVLSATVANGKQGIIVSDPQGRISFWTEGAEELSLHDEAGSEQVDPADGDFSPPVASARSGQLRDPVTGLTNRKELLELMSPALAAAALDGTLVMVQLIYLNQLEAVNDAYGLAAGDQLLKAVAHGLNGAIDAEDTLARFGDDEFVIFRERTNGGDAEDLADKISEVLADPFDIGGHRLYPIANIGMAVIVPHDGDPNALMQAARTAMLNAKRRGRIRSSMFDTRPITNSAERLMLAAQLHEAVSTSGLELHYSPVIELVSGRLIGLEATSRWKHPTRGWVPPEVFLAVAEESNVASKLDGWALGQACTDAVEFRRRGVLPPWASVAVQVSAQTASDPELLESISQAAATARIGIDVLVLEVAATRLLADSPAARRVMEALRELGVGFTLYKFGTGHASLAQLRQLPVTALKIDRTFIQHMTEHADDRAIVASLIDLASARGIRTIAEGVVTADQLFMLDRLGCAAGQGDLWSEPLTRSELILYLKKHKAGGFQSAKSSGAPRQSERRQSVRPTNEHGLHRLQQLHRELASPDTIAAALNSEGYQTPAGVRWHGKSVAAMLAELDGERRRRRG